MYRNSVIIITDNLRSIKDLVNNIVKKYNTRDPFKIAKELDVILLTVPLKDVNGFYQYYKRNTLGSRIHFFEVARSELSDKSDRLPAHGGGLRRGRKHRRYRDRRGNRRADCGACKEGEKSRLA